MIDLAHTRYQLAALVEAGGRTGWLHLMDAVRTLSWEEQVDEFAMRLTAVLSNQRLPTGWLHQSLALGGHLVLRADWGTGWQEVFRGMIRRWGYTPNQAGELSLTAYDPLYSLLHSKDDRYYPEGTSGRTVLMDLASAWDLPIGTVEGPDVNLSRTVFRGQRLSSIIFDVLEQARKRGSGRLLMRSREGHLEIVRPGQNQPVYHLNADSLEHVDDHQDIETLVTRVRLLGAEDDEGRRPIVSEQDGHTEFGLLQEIVYADEFDTPAAAQKAAQEVLEERGKPRKRRSIKGPDLPWLRKGDRIHLAAGTLDGYFLVSGIEHDATTRTMRVEVEDE